MFRLHKKGGNSPSKYRSAPKLVPPSREEMMPSRAFAALSKTWQTIRPRLGGAILCLVVCCAPVVALTWCFDVIDDLQARVGITTLVALMPAIELMSLPRPLRSRRDLFGLGAFLLLLLLMMVGDRFDWPVLKLNAVILVVILPYCVVAWVLMGRRRRLILLCALLLGLVAMMVYWVKAMVDTNAPWELLLAPVPAVLLAGIVWVPVARFALNWAQSCKSRPMAGPGTQVLAMISLFLPVILIAIFVPGMLCLSQIWSAVSLTILGVLLSAVVAQPLRRFLLEWTELKPDKNAAG